ncbi:hypothetical protein DHW03_05605 [Pedobacter yonginense]|uniref:DUF4279 domain-containing protein n=1 Tax=Pedobacter yonginense TaxID=651869 RepID=A0A317ES95_9SPHI|nr:DUF4279 domain-containing protein [Pedobacter yonginense]PWS29292.1 hypothetical protein DHW03_05605 [Pedobacter yonginense]
MKKHEIILTLGIWDFEDISHDEITKEIGVIPIKQYFKGQKVNSKLPESKLAKENGWIIEPPGFQKYDDFSSQMDSFITLVKFKYKFFNMLFEKYHCEFSCAIFLSEGSEDSTPWVHLGDDYNEVFGENNVHFDLDLYRIP